jgi:hypothetical protein
MSHKPSFSGNVKFFLGSFGHAVFIVNLVLLLFGGSAAMVLMALETLRSVFGIGELWVDILVVVIALGIVAIVGDDPGGNRLRFTSVFALVCVGYFGLLLVIQSCRGPDTEVSVTSMDLSSFTTAASIFVNLFIMNFIIYHIASNSGQRGLQLTDKMNTIIAYSIWIVIVPVYLFVGISGYLSFSDNGGSIPSNILIGRWSIHPLLLDSGRVALSLVNLFKLPLLLIPLRHNIFPQHTTIRDSDDNIPNLSMFTNRVSLESAVVVMVLFMVTYFTTDLSTIFRWTGSTCGICLGFIIPASMYYKLQLIEEEQADLARRIMTYHQSLPDTDPVTPSAARSAKRRLWKKISSACVIVVSSLYSIGSLIVNLGLVEDSDGYSFSTYMNIFVN